MWPIIGEKVLNNTITMAKYYKNIYYEIDKLRNEIISTPIQKY